MPNFDFLTDEELDTLLTETPVFDTRAVKRRVLAELPAESKPAPAAKNMRHIGRGLLMAAIICILSVSCLAVADLASGGRISAALGIAPVAKVVVPEVPVEQEKLTPDNPVSVSPAQPESQPEPQPEPAELGAELTNSFSFTPAQTQLLRPAAQTVNKTVKNQNVDMTVLQTLGDSRYLYIVVRFDFPEDVPVDTTYRFSDMDFLVDGKEGSSWSTNVADCTDHSVTYLISARSQEALSGQTVTVRYSDYGFYKPDEQDVTTLTLPSGKVSTVQISADGNIVFDNTDATVSIGDKTTIQTGDVSIVVGGEEESAPAGDSASAAQTSAEQTPPIEAEPVREPVRTETDTSRGVTTDYYADGSILVTYDGTHGDQYLAVADEGLPSVRILEDPSGHPGFNTLLPGKWEQSWTLSYQDLSKSWSGRESIFDPALILTSLRISPLSWCMEYDGNLDQNDPDAAIPYVPEMTVTLLMTDGSKQNETLHLNYRSNYTEEDGSFRVTSEHLFNTPIDPSKISAVIIDGKTFPLT